MKLWLDDLRDPEQHGAIGFQWAKTYDEAIALLASGEVEFASLDHDLGDCRECEIAVCPHEKTGYDVVCWMEGHNVWPVNGVKVHSANPVGKARMMQVIDRHYQG